MAGHADGMRPLLPRHPRHRAPGPGQRRQRRPPPGEQPVLLAQRATGNPAPSPTPSPTPSPPAVPDHRRRTGRYPSRTPRAPRAGQRGRELGVVAGAGRQQGRLGSTAPAAAGRQAHPGTATSYSGAPRHRPNAATTPAIGATTATTAIPVINPTAATTTPTATGIT